jgi:hypothetical protein
MHSQLLGTDTYEILVVQKLIKNISPGKAQLRFAKS